MGEFIFYGDSPEDPNALRRSVVMRVNEQKAYFLAQSDFAYAGGEERYSALVGAVEKMVQTGTSLSEINEWIEGEGYASYSTTRGLKRRLLKLYDDDVFANLSRDQINSLTAKKNNLQG